MMIRALGEYQRSAALVVYSHRNLRGGYIVHIQGIHSVHTLQ